MKANILKNNTIMRNVFDYMKEFGSRRLGLHRIEVRVTSGGASDEHPMSTRWASDGSRWKHSGNAQAFWKYAAMFVMVLTLGVGQMWGVTFTKVTDVSSLSSGDEIIIVSESASKALSTTQNGNNRAATAVTISSSEITDPEDVEVITLGTSNGNWTFYAPTPGGTAGYLYAASSSKNYLRTQSSNDANGEWTIAISNGDATITAQGSNTRNLMQYNNSNTIFSCYNSTQTNGSIQIYKKGASTFTATLAVNTAGYGTVSPTSVGSLSSGAAITKGTGANINKITIGSTTVTATPTAQTADYTYTFSSWTVPGNVTTVTADITITANFTRTERALTNYRTLCCVELGAITSSISLSNASNNVTASGWGATSGGNETGYLVRLYNSDKSAVITSGNTGSKATKTYTFSNPGAGTYWVSVTPTYSGAGNYCEAGTETFSASSVTITGNVTVTFDATTNGGSISTSTQSVPHNESTALTSWSTLGGSAPSCKQFAHWNTEADDSGESYADGASITATGAVTLYAIYSTNTYTISDGTMTGVASHSYSANPINCGTTLTITCAADASHKGNPTVTATGTHGAITVVSATSVTIANVQSNMTVTISYAARANCTVTLNPGNGTLTAGNSWVASGSNLTQTVLEGNATTAMPDPTPGCSGWSFVGWKAGSAADNQASFTPDKTSGATVSPNANVTYYAVYQRSTSGSSTTFTKITGTSNLVTGNYQFSSGSYAMQNVDEGSYMHEISGYSSSDASHTVTDGTLIWKIIKFNTQVAIMNGSNFLGIDGNNEITLTTTPQFFTYEYNTVNSRWEFTSVTNSSYQLAYCGSPKYYRMGTAQDNAISLYKQNDDLSGNYYSSPSCSDYTITGVADPVAGGSVTLSASSGKTGDKVYALCTADPAYNFVNWTKSDADASLSSTTAQVTELTVASSNVTLTANFAAKVTRSVTWKNNGVELTAAERGSASTSVEDGQHVSAIPDALASGADGKSCDKDGHPTFVGWTATPISGTSGSAPSDLFADAANAPVVSGGNVTYHAVWADGGGEFALVSSAPSDWSGTYLIVNSAKTYAMSSDFYSGTSGEFKGVSVTNSNNKISTNNDKLIWIIERKGATGDDASKYSFKNKSTGTYAKITGTSSTNAALDANAVWFTIEDAGSSLWDIASVSNSARCFAYYASNTSFRTYAKTNYNTGYLYKLAPATSYRTSCACVGYSMHFGTKNDTDWNSPDAYCFEESEDADGSTGVYWYLKDFELPAKEDYYLGWQGEWNTTNAKSADAKFSGLCFGLLRESSCETNTLGTYSSGNNQGAVGTLRVRSSFGDNNKYIDFIPGGYVLRLSDDNGSSYASTAFVAASSSLTETVWTTNITTISAALASSGKYFVDLKTNSDHVWAPNVSQVANISSMGYKKVDGSWGTGLSSGMRGKFRIWADNCSKNWNCHFVPYYHLSYDGNGAGATNLPEASADKSCEGDNSARTVNVSTTVPTRDGYTFIGWNTAPGGGGTSYAANDPVVLTSDMVLYAQWAQNFTVTYDLNDGAADPICSGGTYYVGQSVTVCSTTPTKTSSSFLGWKRLDTDATVAGGSTFTMPSNNVTIQAQWETVYFHIYYKEEDGTAIATDDVPQTAETTLRNQTPCVGYTFFGWSTSKITTETTSKPAIIGKGGAKYTPEGDITVYPVYARSEGATTVKDTLTSTCIGSGSGYRSFTNFQHHSDAKYSGWATVGNTSIQMSDACGIVTTTSGGKLKHVTIKYHSKTGVDRSVDLYGQNSNYSNVTAAMSTPTGTKIGTATKTTAVNYEQTFELPSSGSDFDTEYEDLAIKCTYGAAYIEELIVTWGTGTYYYATHCETKENVTVTYNGNGGTVGCGSPANETVTTVTWDYADGGMGAPTLDESQTICNSATREGYVLSKWNTAADGTGRDYAKGATVTRFGGDSTLYAIWDRVYTVHFIDRGDGSSSPTDTEETQASLGASVPVPSNPTPCNTKPGVTWTFVGWGTQDGLAQSLNGHIEITAGTSTYTPSDDITLYAVYRKSTGTSDAFAIGTSGAYTIGAKQGPSYPECLATTKFGTGYYCSNDGSVPATIFYLNYVNSGEHNGQYTLQDGNTGEYVGYAGSSTSLSFSSTTPYYYNVVANGTGWNIQCSTATTRYFTHETGASASNFKAYQDNNPVTLHPAAASTYYTVASCDDDFNITFVENGSEITWQVNHGEGTYYHLADGTEVSVFPTASFDGWTFLGWRTADYVESTTAPEASTIYGGSDGTSGNHYEIHSSITMYPIFTRFEDNEPFDQINGGDYYIYFLESGSNDGYGGERRVYAGSYSDHKRYESSPLCSGATEFTFTKLANGNWTIKDKTTGNYLYGIDGDDDLKQRASATNSEWTLTVNGNQFDAFHVGTTYGQLIAKGDGTSATFMNYRRTNISQTPSLYHRVYLGGCSNRTFTTNPSTTPTIEVHGQVKVTSTATKSVKARNVLTVTANNISTANLTVTSDNSAFKFSLTSNGSYTASVNIPVVSNKVGVTPVYIEYTPAAGSTSDGVEGAIVTVSDGAGTPTSVSTVAGDVQGRHVPENFVIAAQLDNKWYALPANCTTSGTWQGILIEVDNASDPTTATLAPSYTKFGLREVASGRYAANGSNVTFTERISTATANDQKTLYNGSTTNIQVDAMWKGYHETNPQKYEWVPSTDDFKDYTLTSADGSNTRPLCMNTSGMFGTYNSAQAYSGKVRLLPATFYEEAAVQVLEWKANSIVVMYTGTEATATTRVGSNSVSGSQNLAKQKLTHAIYELTTNQALTSNDGKMLLLGFGDTKKAFDIPLIINSAVTATTGHDKQDVVIVSGGKLTAAATKYSYRNVYVYGGGKLKIASGTQLGVNNIILRAGGITTSGIGSSPSATYNYVYPQVELGGTLTSTVADIKYEYITDYDHWYHLCLPFNGTLSTITYPTEYYGTQVTKGNKGSWIIKRYAGEVRATGNVNAWVDIESESATEVIAGHGYIYWGAPKKISVGDAAAQRPAWGIQRITMSTTAAAATTAETDNKTVSDLSSYSDVEGKSDYLNDWGWNLIGNPFMTNLKGLTSDDIVAGKLEKEIVNGKWTGKWINNGDGTRYVTIPSDHFNTYKAKTTATASNAGDFMPGRAFFVQIDGDATGVTFNTANRDPLTTMPALLKATATDVETGIVMSNSTLKDEVNFWIKDGKTVEYEYNADYPKTPNQTNFNIYGVHSHGDLSWVAISPEIAATSMAIGYQVPAAGTYTLTMSETYVSDEVESLFVTDHAVEPEKTVDLLAAPYMYEFNVNQAETNNTRFTISIVLKEEAPGDPDSPGTGLDQTAGADDKPLKFIYNDKMYILRNGIIYDAVGKKVREIK